ncbi:MAG: hypothetical protein AVDCRST_MAG65-1639 [uncultured Solirubrobacteraceae bacterium]|uniref:Uncharacterized protein n=1 Tax=uncultured Solirubrobacteraceae bacterium TaxID=1162706 RepID=A0A6J4RXF7_9ACTN|nr:MAG: hypothetical protein AVDCRST_MAG65-1639 [uncultured Solirubrobacteraceae bacterium]
MSSTSWSSQIVTSGKLRCTARRPGSERYSRYLSRYSATVLATPTVSRRTVVYGPVSLCGSSGAS